MMALEAEIAKATKLSRGERDIWTIYIFADNKSAVEQILRPKLGPSQMHAVRTCTRIRDFLDEVSIRSVQLAWCPGHVGVKDNERVDKSAAEGTNKLQPKFMSFARARELVRTKILNEWRIKAETDPEYRGKQWFDIHGGIGNIRYPNLTDLKWSSNGDDTSLPYPMSRNGHWELGIRVKPISSLNTLVKDKKKWPDIFDSGLVICRAEHLGNGST